jgi:hypothetical protein
VLSDWSTVRLDVTVLVITLIAGHAAMTLVGGRYRAVYEIRGAWKGTRR